MKAGRVPRDAEDVGIGADHDGRRIVRREPRRERAVHVAYVRRPLAEVDDPGADALEERDGLVVELRPGIAAAAHDHEAWTDHVVEPPCASGLVDETLYGERARRGSTREDPVLEVRERRGLDIGAPKARITLRRGSRVELT